MTGRPGQFDSKRRAQLLLQQIDQLPTLSSVAVRLLTVTASDDSCARDVVELISADPSLASKVISLCRRASRGVSIEDGDLQRAVVLLGFDEVRMTALSVKVFELMRGMTSPGGERHGEATAFDPAMFWRHCLAAGATAELIALESRHRKTCNAGEAFLCGLLHDLGQLALFTVLPRTFDRVCQLAEENRLGIDVVCRKIIGISPALFGKHLADHWRLPENLVNAIWLHGQHPETLPSCLNRDLVNIASCADLLARRQLIAHVGHAPAPEECERFVTALGLEPALVVSILDRMHDAVSERAEMLGIGRETPAQLLRSSIDRANRLLQSIRRQHKEPSETASQSLVVRACAEFFQHAPADSSIPTVLCAVARSACTILAPHLLVGMTLRARDIAPESFRFDADWRPVRVDAFGAKADHDEVREIKLETAGDADASILHHGALAAKLEPAALEVLRRLWGHAVSAATARERAAELSEELVETNRSLIEAQDSLAEKRAMASLGELASGAAHEMNNPLTVISGRSQLLAAKLDVPALRSAAADIVRQTKRLSDLITGLRLSAEIDPPHRRTVNVEDLARSTMAAFTDRVQHGGKVRVEVEPRLGPARLDDAHIHRALIELLQNAHEADDGCDLTLRVQTDPLDDRLMFLVIDSGPGLSERATAHAFDPFFSEKPAGRRTGLGLSRARRLVEINGGEISLMNGARSGAVATITLSGWRDDAQSNRSAA